MVKACDGNLKGDWSTKIYKLDPDLKNRKNFITFMISMDYPNPVN